MQPLDLISTFRASHKKLKERSLPENERPLYLQLREQLARAIVGAQALGKLKGESARRHFRIATVRPLELQIGEKKVRVATVDLSAGGLSALMDPAPRVDETLDFSLALDAGKPLTGRAKVVSTFGHAQSSRVSLAFISLAEADLERLEIYLFDLLLERMPG